MVHRTIEELIRRRLREYPAVALVGPRQSGKTTLARAFGKLYFDLEQPGDRTRLDVQFDEIAAGRTLLILDEAQSMPEIFPRLRGAIDRPGSRKGRFLLLGSIAPSLMTHVSESLAGRLALVELSPLTAGEVPAKPLWQLWLRGGFPGGGILNASRYPVWQRGYLDLLCQRDLPAWGLPAKPQMTRRLMEMMAALNGQEWNASQLGQSLGLSYHTVNSYLDYMEGIFLVRRLRPYFASIPKRLAKSQRVYFRDSGLVHALLGIDNRQQLLSQSWVGKSWEGFVIEQVIVCIGQRGWHVDPFFLRDRNRTEIDLLLSGGGRKWAIEIKLTSSPNPHDLARLRGAADLVGAEKRFLVSQTAESVGSGDSFSCNLPWLLEYISQHWGE